MLSTEKRDYMSKRKKIKTTKEQIVEYWEAEVDECVFWRQGDTGTLLGQRKYRRKYRAFVP